MKFECKDLERALSVPELLPDVREHIRDCAACRREMWFWTEISNVAGGLREEWESPELWPRVQNALAAEIGPRRPPRWFDWRMLSAIAATLVIAVGLLAWFTFRRRQASGSETADFLTERALKEVEQSEAAYVKSIDTLSHAVEGKLKRPDTPLNAAYREKLLLLDSAITELRAAASQNRFNARLQSDLADLYRQKQETLKEIAHLGQKN